MKKKFAIKNPSGQKIIGLIERPKGPGLLETIIFSHGFKGFKEQKYIEYLANYFSKKLCFVRFDFTNGIGESEGDILNISVGHYLGDLQAIFSYVCGLDFVDKKKINIGGASFGGEVAILFAAENPLIKSLILQAPVFRPAELHEDIDPKEWEEKGYWWFHSGSKNIDFKVGYQFYSERSTYDMPKAAKSIKAPTLILHGAADTAVPLKQSRDLFKHLKVKRDLFTIKGAPHTIKGEAHLKQYAQRIDSWLKEVEKS